MSDDAVVVLETFDDPDLARGYRDAVLRSMQRRSIQRRYAVGVRIKKCGGGAAVVGGAVRPKPMPV